MRYIFISLLLLLFSLNCSKSTEQNTPSETKRYIFLDADTANEIDDLYAIVRALVEPSFQVKALASAQYHTQKGAPENTVELSQQLNKEILELMQLDIPHPMGANEPLPAIDQPSPSPAAEMIIESAHALDDGQMLDVVVLGPMTNVASAILMDSTIVNKIRVHVIALLYNAETGEWGKNEFNTNNDPLAMDVLLNTENLDMHIMTATTAKTLFYFKKHVDKRFKGRAAILDYLVNRWEEYVRVKTWSAPTATEHQWIMWDIAIVQTLVNPDFAVQQEIWTPADNFQRTVQVYTEIDTSAMKMDYWKALEKCAH